MVDQRSGGLFGDEPMAETMERVVRDDFYEHRGNGLSLTWARLFIHAIANEMGISVSLAESEKFALLLWGLESDGRITVKRM